ncbi:MAG: nitrilase family protein [Bacteroidales bacterium]|nr:nitrilase family protein [Bacteroidales bacterium]
MNKLKIAVIQHDIVWEKPEENLQQVSNIIKSAEYADIFVLPEMFNTGFSNNVNDMAENINGDTIKGLKIIAKEKDAAICTSIILTEHNKFYNSFLFIKPDGDIIRYDKRHLFKMGGETDMFTPGKDRIVYNYKGVRFLLLVCYDLRFPVWSRNRNDYDAIIYVSSWPITRRHAHDTLLRARAIENLSHVIATNRIGIDGKNLVYDGGSCIIDPKGYPLAEAKNNEQEVIYAEIDINGQNKFRNSFTALEDADDFDISI